MSDSKRAAFLRGLLAAALAVGFSLAPRPGTSEESDDLDYPIFLTSMTHMEGNANAQPYEIAWETAFGSRPAPPTT